MNTRERYQAFVKYLQTAPAASKTELIYATPFQLLVAMVLGAQCTDKRVNSCTPLLFARFPTAGHLAKASFNRVLACIKPISYSKKKTRFLIEMAHQLATSFQHKIPSSVAALQTLPGVGRKTANALVAILYNQPIIAVDTHVFRVAKRTGLASCLAKTPLMVEKELMAHLPIQYIPIANRWIVLHGRYICKARKPQCEQCSLTTFCAYYQDNQHEI
ncbi:MULTISPECIES: endonuclease III [unclassified Candidatus Cardinium]|uniref:endonuclease III domain-containing protein n=1 Tax=unclassified Candidatus Cardinium TaxID=2641185 RepID=UPI001FB2DF59|nr:MULTISPECIES: endonuclease III [unclassified Candidatus Cardinium]